MKDVSRNQRLESYLTRYSPLAQKSKLRERAAGDITPVSAPTVVAKGDANIDSIKISEVKVDDIIKKYTAILTSENIKKTQAILTEIRKQATMLKDSDPKASDQLNDLSFKFQYLSLMINSKFTDIIKKELETYKVTNSDGIYSLNLLNSKLQAVIENSFAKLVGLKTAKNLCMNYNDIMNQIITATESMADENIKFLLTKLKDTSVPSLDKMLLSLYAERDHTNTINSIITKDCVAIVNQALREAITSSIKTSREGIEIKVDELKTFQKNGEKFTFVSLIRKETNGQTGELIVTTRVSIIIDGESADDIYAKLARTGILSPLRISSNFRSYDFIKDALVSIDTVKNIISNTLFPIGMDLCQTLENIRNILAKTPCFEKIAEEFKASGNITKKILDTTTNEYTRETIQSEGNYPTTFLEKILSLYNNKDTSPPLPKAVVDELESFFARVNSQFANFLSLRSAENIIVKTRNTDMSERTGQKESYLIIDNYFDENFFDAASVMNSIRSEYELDFQKSAANFLSIAFSKAENDFYESYPLQAIDNYGFTSPLIAFLYGLENGTTERKNAILRSMSYLIKKKGLIDGTSDIYLLQNGVANSVGLESIMIFVGKLIQSLESTILAPIVKQISDMTKGILVEDCDISNYLKNQSSHHTGDASFEIRQLYSGFFVEECSSTKKTSGGGVSYAYPAYYTDNGKTIIKLSDLKNFEKSYSPECADILKLDTDFQGVMNKMRHSVISQPNKHEIFLNTDFLSPLITKIQNGDSLTTDDVQIDNNLRDRIFAEIEGKHVYQVRLIAANVDFLAVMNIYIGSILSACTQYLKSNHLLDSSNCPIKLTEGVWKEQDAVDYLSKIINFSELRNFLESYSLPNSKLNGMELLKLVYSASKLNPDAIRIFNTQQKLKVEKLLTIEGHEEQLDYDVDFIKNLDTTSRYLVQAIINKVKSKGNIIQDTTSNGIYRSYIKHYLRLIQPNLLSKLFDKDASLSAEEASMLIFDIVTYGQPPLNRETASNMLINCFSESNTVFFLPKRKINDQNIDFALVKLAFSLDGTIRTETLSQIDEKYQTIRRTGSMNEYADKLNLFLAYNMKVALNQDVDEKIETLLLSNPGLSEWEVAKSINQLCYQYLEIVKGGLQLVLNNLDSVSLEGDLLILPKEKRMNGVTETYGYTYMSISEIESKIEFLENNKPEEAKILKTIFNIIISNALNKLQREKDIKSYKMTLNDGGVIRSANVVLEHVQVSEKSYLGSEDRSGVATYGGVVANGFLIDAAIRNIKSTFMDRNSCPEILKLKTGVEIKYYEGSYSWKVPSWGSAEAVSLCPFEDATKLKSVSIDLKKLQNSVIFTSEVAYDIAKTIYESNDMTIIKQKVTAAINMLKTSLSEGSAIPAGGENEFRALFWKKLQLLELIPKSEVMTPEKLVLYKNKYPNYITLTFIEWKLENNKVSDLAKHWNFIVSCIDATNNLDGKLRGYLQANNAIQELISSVAISGKKTTIVKSTIDGTSPPLIEVIPTPDKIRIEDQKLLDRYYQSKNIPTFEKVADSLAELIENQNWMDTTIPNQGVLYKIYGKIKEEIGLPSQLHSDKDKQEMIDFLKEFAAWIILSKCNEGSLPVIPLTKLTTKGYREWACDKETIVKIITEKIDYIFENKTGKKMPIILAEQIFLPVLRGIYVYWLNNGELPSNDKNFFIAG